MDSYYENDKDINYIITSNKGYIKSYNYNKNKLYYKYNKNNNYFKINSFLIYKDGEILKIIESSENGDIRFWGFHSGILYSKFNIDNNWIGGICIYKDKYLLIGCGNKCIKIVILENGVYVKSLSGHEGKVCSIKKINIPNLGECIFSLGKDNKIRKWTNIIQLE